MSELTERLRKAAYQVRSPRATDVLTLCDEHERLEAEVQRLEDVVLQRNAARDVGEIEATERLTAQIGALCDAAETHAVVELRRLEGLLRAWKLAADALDTATLRVGFDDPNFMTTVSGYQDEVDATRRAVYAESVRLAKEKM